MREGTEKDKKMRSEAEVTGLILNIAKADERVRAVLLSGSRANPAVPKDQYQDYDICFYVTDIKPFYDNPEWVNEKFGKPLIMQTPETMRFPAGDGHFCYLMIFPDGVRIDLSFEFRNYADDGEPAITLLDKDNGKGFLPPLPPPSDKIWHIQPPSALYYYSCCNNFWWCLNNVAKGIMRDELAYTMNMLNQEVRGELHCMIDWYIGVTKGFTLSTGKNGKYFKKLLPKELYIQYAKTYSGGGSDEMWDSVYVMCGLFHTLALPVAKHFGFSYRHDEEDAIMKYMQMVRQ